MEKITVNHEGGLCKIIALASENTRTWKFAIWRPNVWNELIKKDYDQLNFKVISQHLTLTGRKKDRRKGEKEREKGRKNEKENWRKRKESYKQRGLNDIKSI